MVFHLPWCAAFSITLCLHCLAWVDWGDLLFAGLIDICVCLHAHWGSSKADVRLVVAVFAFSPQPSAAGKSLCLSVLACASCYGRQMLDRHAPDLQHNSSKKKKKKSLFSQSDNLRSLSRCTKRGYKQYYFASRGNFTSPSKQTKSPCISNWDSSKLGN